MTCEICNGIGFEITDAGAKPCRCRIQREAQPQGRPITPPALKVAMGALSALAFFPTDPAAQMLIGDELRRMCPSVEALQFAVALAVRRFKTWDKCGLSGLRQALCLHYRPADGIEAGPTEMYPEGLPSETKHDPLALPAGAQKRLVAAEASEDAEMQRGVEKASQASQMPKSRVSDGKFERRLREIITPPCDREDPKPGPKPMSMERRLELQAEIDRITEERREQRAKESA